MTTPDQLLADAKWRRRHSVYLTWAVLCGLGFVSFLYTGLRAHKNRWIALGVLYGVLSIGTAIIGSALAPDDPNADYPVGATLAYLAFFATWVGSAVHAFHERKEWLTWKASVAEQQPWYASSTARPSTATVEPALADVGLDDATGDFLAAPRPNQVRPPPSAPRRPPPPPAKEQRSAHPPVPAAPAVEPEATELIDLNSASVDEIADLAGIGVALAKRIVEERTRRGGFSSVGEVADALRLQPHVLSRLQRAATVSDKRSVRRRGSTGRIVDI